MSTITGTSHFVSKESAEQYYRPYERGRVEEVVAELLDDGSIHIGPPALKPGETLSIIDGGTRYAITEATEKPFGTEECVSDCFDNERHSVLCVHASEPCGTSHDAGVLRDVLEGI